MRSLGPVLHSVHRDLLVLDAETVAKPGSKVVDRDGRRAGVVTDVIGPVTSPYIVVRVRGPPDRFVGQRLYAK